MINWPIERKRQAGFSLLELSIVLIVVGLLAGSLLRSTAGQRLADEENRADRQLALAIEALYGHAIAFGRLPCPAAPSLPDSAADAGTEDCANQHGVLPWRTLGLPATDPWGNRLTYYVRSLFTTPPAADARAGFALDSAGNAAVKPASSSGNKLADTLPAVVVSHGPNGHGGYRPDGTRHAVGSPDEAENADADLSFVSHPPSADFDDRLDWLVPTVLMSRMLAAGRLP